jgi:hypothetical protein
MEIGIELYSEKLVEDIKPLLELHYQELTLNKEHIKLDPDWHKYSILAKNKSLVVITARDQGKLVGYSVFFITNHLHYQQNKMANNDVLFLHEDYRKGTTGIKLIKESEKALKDLGIIKILWHIKFAKDFRKILYRLGYHDEDAIVGKILKD